MRKLMALAFCLILVAVAVPAKAASKIEFEGELTVLHHNLVNFNRANDKRYVQSDSFFENRLHFGVDFKPSDDLLVHWSFRSPDYVRWGVATQGSSNAAEVYTRAIYATITQEWGELSIGRLEEGFPTSNQGLATLGYGYGGDLIYISPFDNASVVDGISYTKKFDNGFGINVYYAKDATQDTDASVQRIDKDIDIDRFGVEPFYQWEGGGASLLFEYVRDMTDNIVISPTNQLIVDVRKDKDYAFFINPAVMQTWGAFSLRFEGKIGWGETTERDLLNNNARAKTKNKGLGLYGEANYNYGAGDINLIAWFADGSSWRERLDPKATKHDLVDMGDFAPFLVAYYGNTLPNRVSNFADINHYNAGAVNSYGLIDRGILGNGNNHWGIGILGNHSLTDSIKLNYGIGYFELVEAYRLGDLLGIRGGDDKDLGVEVDLGVHIQLMENLSFESQFGYMFNGNAYQNVYEDRNGNFVFSDPKDTYAWVSALTVTF
ncbi:MAG: hypothetical protein LBI10_07545 [Deltaproteobacteria bacterium]|jgi:hypothetical protein|nr:hypothetical protein [Deltaproteobacteria bacterium]